MDKTVKFENVTFAARLASMLKVDLRRLFKTPLIYIILAACLAAPVVILVMTTMMAGTVSVNPQTGVETVVEGFDSVWQIIGTVSTDASAGADAAGMGMSITSMCNINMLYFAIAALVCIFVADDFRSGYAKNLFTVRSRKKDYVISKTVVLTLGSALMILVFFIGSLLGGAISDLSFEMTGFDKFELFMCILSKMLLTSVFVPIYLVMSVVAKQRLWLSILLSFGVGMFLFMMIPMLTPLNAGITNALLCIAGGALLATGLGTVSALVLKKTSLV